MGYVDGERQRDMRLTFESGRLCLDQGGYG